MTTGRSRLRGSGGGGGCRRAGLRLRSQLGAGLGSGELSDCLLSLLGDRDGGEGGGTRRGFDVRSSPPASSQVATLTTTNSPWTTASKDLPASVARTWLMRKRSEEDRPSAPRRPEPLSVLAKWLQICNRQNTTENMEASWTCCRTLDGTCVQLDYILANFRLRTVEVWNDFTLPIGLDHRCAHCISRFQWCSRPRMRQHRGLKWWQQTLDSNGLPAKFHNILRMNKVRGQHNSLEGLERSLRDAGQQGGNRENTYLRFQPSDGLKRLRAQRRATMDTQLRKSLTFSSRKNHRQEIRAWKTERLNAQLGHAKNWQTLRKMQFATTGSRQQQTPQPNAFAHMLGEFFCRKSSQAVPPTESDRKPVDTTRTSMSGEADENSQGC